MSNEDTLRSEIGSIGIRNALFGIEFCLSLVLTMVAGIVLFSYPLQSEIILGINCAFITASGALLGLSVAAFSIVLSFTGNRDMLTVFFKGQFFKATKVDFSVISIISGICIVTSLFSIILLGALDLKWASLFLCLPIFFFLWGVFGMVMLVTNTIRLLSNFRAYCHLCDEEDSE